jgi:iron complex outermembrane receptor protein
MTRRFAGSASIAQRALLVGLSVAASHTTVQAQEAAQGIEEIVVTARRRAESVQDAPLSMSAFSGKALEERGASQLEDYIRATPGVSILSTGATGFRGDARPITIRGITPGAGDAAFGLYLDDSPLPTGDPKLFDIARVEVLRGPQGTLYGQGTSGGAIKIVSKQPDSSAFAADALASLGTISDGSEAIDLNAMINLPLGNTTAVRVVGFHKEHGGYIDRIGLPASFTALLGPDAVAGTAANAREDVNDEVISGFRAAARFAIGEHVEVTPSFFHQHARVEARPTMDPRLGDLVQAREVDTSEEQDLNLAALKLNGDFSWGSLTSVTTYFETEDEGNEDLTNLVRLALLLPRGISLPAGAGMLATRSRESLVQELRIASRDEADLRWLLGAYYQDYDQGPKDGQRTLHGVAEGLTAAAPFFPFVDDTFVTNTTTQSVEELSFFGELSYAFTPRLTGTIGLRHFDVETARVTNRGGFFNGFVPLDGNPPLVTGSREDGLRPKVALSYDITDDHLVYASASEGFRRGGANNPAPTAVCGNDLAALGLTESPTSFDADPICSYEIGAKTAWAGNALIANLAVYRIEWSDIQQLVDMRCGFNFTANIGEARSDGFELELTSRPVTGLEVSVAVGHTDAKITSVPEDLAGLQFSAGQRLQNVPEWTYGATVSYSAPITSALRAIFRAQYDYVDDRLYSSSPTAAFGGILESYELLGVQIGIEGDTWSLTAFVENALDQRPLLNVSDFGTTALNPEAYTTQPRTIGLAYRVRL